jgi:hypothetical protein
LSGNAIISQLGGAPDDLRHDHPEIRRRRLLFRCGYRGTQEIDLLLGSFAETSLACLAAPGRTGSKTTLSWTMPSPDISN